MMRFLFVDVIRGIEPNHKVGVRRLLANACVFRATHYLSLRA